MDVGLTSRHEWGVIDTSPTHKKKIGPIHKKSGILKA